MDDLKHSINYDFNFMLYLFNNSVQNLRAEDKNLAIAWVNKLRTSTSFEEARLRNDFLQYLVNNCQSGELKPPFREKPPKGPLLNILNLLPMPLVQNNKPKSTKKPEVFDKSPDKGAFLAAQPVPRCGAFCYIAVISRSPPPP